MKMVAQRHNKTPTESVINHENLLNLAAFSLLMVWQKNIDVSTLSLAVDIVSNGASLLPQQLIELLIVLSHYATVMLTENTTTVTNMLKGV